VAGSGLHACRSGIELAVKLGRTLRRPAMVSAMSKIWLLAFLQVFVVGEG
jgi:hypothetical protein